MGSYSNTIKKLILA